MILFPASVRKTVTLVVCIIMLASTFTSFSTYSSSFIRNAQAQPVDGETRECTVEDYVVSLDEVPTDGDGIDILSNIDNSQKQNQLFTNDISSTGNKIQPSTLPT